MSESRIEEEKKTPVIKEVDILICGVGCAGFGAALSAGWSGLSALAIERYGFLGGGLTSQNVTPTPIWCLTPIPEYGITKPLSGGVYKDLIERLAQLGGAVSVEDVVRLGWKGKGVQGMTERGREQIGAMHTHTDIELMKYVMQEMLLESHVELLLHTSVVDAIVEKNVIKGVIIENKSGRQAILAKIVIDCTGDGDIFAKAGAPYMLIPGRPRDGYISAMQQSIDWTIINVDMKKAFPYLNEKKKVDDLIRTAVQKKELPGPVTLLPMGNMGVWPYPYKWFRVNDCAVWGPDSRGDIVNVEDLTVGEVNMREKVLTYLNWIRKNIPGFEEACIGYTPTQIGTRESRRVEGEYILTGLGDVYYGRRHKDVVVRVFRYVGDTPLTKEEPLGPLFDIPYRCLVPLWIDNLLVAGRCISIDHNTATYFEPREEDTCTILGDVAGEAAALCIKNNVRPRDLDVKLLQRNLTRKGFNLYEPYEYT